MEVITSNILHLGVIAIEDDFQRGVRRGEEKKAEQSFAQDLQISWIKFGNLCAHLVLFPPDNRSWDGCTRINSSTWITHTVVSHRCPHGREGGAVKQMLMISGITLVIFSVEFWASLVHIQLFTVSVCPLSVCNHKPPKKLLLVCQSWAGARSEVIKDSWGGGEESGEGEFRRELSGPNYIH